MNATFNEAQSLVPTSIIASLLSFLFTSSAWSDTVVPQIMLTDDVVERIETRRTTDAVLASAYEALLASADAHLDQPTIVEALRSDTSELRQSFVGFDQKPVERLTTMGMAWRLTGDKRYADRARLELLQLADLETWYPENFLGLSRVTLAVALGYSWISETLDDGDHAAIKSALVNKALNEAAGIYELDTA